MLSYFFKILLIFHFTFFLHKPDNPQIKIAAPLQSAAGRPQRKRKLSLNAVLELVESSKFMIFLKYISWHDMC